MKPAKPESAPLLQAESAALVRVEPTPMELISEGIAKGITPEGLATLYNLKRDIDADKAKAAYVADFTALQLAMPEVQATKSITTKEGQLKYSYAPYKDIWRVVGPFLKQFHFAVMFRSRQDGERLVVCCALMHSGGHVELSEYPIRPAPVQGGGNAEADEGALTRGKRLALCQALNIVVEGTDQDARNIGQPITVEQADDLSKRVSALGAKINLSAFWKFAGAETFAEIPSTKYAEIDALLTKKEGAA